MISIIILSLYLLSPGHPALVRLGRLLPQHRLFELFDILYCIIPYCYVYMYMYVYTSLYIYI